MLQQVLISDTTGNRIKQIDMITNLSNQNLDLGNSVLTIDDDILYANGNTKTIVRFQPKDFFGNQINSDLSSRIQFEISEEALILYRLKPQLRLHLLMMAHSHIFQKFSVQTLQVIPH